MPVHPNAASPSATQPDPTRTKVSSTILADALELLDREKRETIRTQLLSSTITADTAVDEVYGTAYKLQQSVGVKRSYWKYGNHKICLQDQVDKVLRLLDRFKSIGNVVANVDPIHVGLPWAGMRAVLEVGTAHRAFTAEVHTDSPN